MADEVEQKLDEFIIYLTQKKLVRVSLLVAFDYMWAVGYTVPMK